jgi:PRTRC genetic system ThiF family protein
MTGIFDPNVHIRTITIVGLGGTGAQVARIVGRIAYDLQRQRLHTPQIVLIDPDRVEESNIGRQLFAPADIGHYKAEIVGLRLNRALGLNVRWIIEPVDAERHFERHGNVVVSCVDNHLARGQLHQVDGVLIGSGNHAETGQVCIGNTADRKRVEDYLDGREGIYPFLPKEGLLFPQLLEPELATPHEPEPDVSCADLVLQGLQHLLVNDFMACAVGQYVYRLLHRQPIASFITYLSTEDLVMRSVSICRDELSTYLRALSSS